jgi:hypothetical protein
MLHCTLINIKHRYLLSKWGPMIKCGCNIHLFLKLGNGKLLEGREKMEGANNTY